MIILECELNFIILWFERWMTMMGFEIRVDIAATILCFFLLSATILCYLNWMVSERKIIQWLICFVLVYFFTLLPLWWHVGQNMGQWTPFFINSLLTGIASCRILQLSICILGIVMVFHNFFHVVLLSLLLNCSGSGIVRLLCIQWRF